MRISDWSSDVCSSDLVPDVLARSVGRFTNAPPAGAFRGFGVPQAALAHEALMDDLAAQLGIDPLEFRALNAIRVGDATATGQVLEASAGLPRSEEHTSELQSLIRISYAVFCLKKNKKTNINSQHT